MPRGDRMEGKTGTMPTEPVPQPLVAVPAAAAHVVVELGSGPHTMLREGAQHRRSQLPPECGRAW